MIKFPQQAYFSDSSARNTICFTEHSNQKKDIQSKWLHIAIYAKLLANLVCKQS